MEFLQGTLEVHVAQRSPRQIFTGWHPSAASNWSKKVPNGAGSSKPWAACWVRRH